MTYLQLLAGFALLFGGAEFLVRGAVLVASKLGLSAMLIGMTVVGFGTSAPEFVVSLNAAFDGSPGIAMGNVVGSNIANIWLILGVAALIAPVMVNTRAVIRDAMMLVGSTVLFALLCLFGIIEHIAGGILFLLLIGYFLWVYRQERTDGAAAHLHEREAEEFQDVPMNIWVAWGSALGGLAALVYGADLLVGSGTVLARDAGVPEEVIGLTLFAIGTSLPELAASVTAAWRGHADVAIGNIVGSNLFNTLGVAGGVAALTTLPVPEQIAGFDLWVMVVATFMLLAYLTLSVRLRRRDGALFAGIYCAYIAAQIVGVDRLMAWFV
ncbi:MAG: calcium/sodium antiporter [Rhodospirillales bacterium]|nr:calcium/sodium antiporter [Rhodospirillales bacterium]